MLLTTRLVVPLTLASVALAFGLAARGLAAGGRPMQFEATAYSVDAEAAQGTKPREGVVAADPAILPLGTRIRVSDAGPYSGVYVVRNTGRTITGREIDLYLRSDDEAKRFGRKAVQVRVLEYGDGRPAAKHG